MKPYSLLPFSTIIVLFFGCNGVIRESGNGNMVTKEIEVSDYEEINIAGNFEIILKRGDSPLVVLTADENLHEFIEVGVSGDRLEIETTKPLSSEEGLTLEIIYDELASIDVGGAATITSQEPIEGDYLNISMSGAGAVDLEVRMKVLKTSVSGAGAVELRGSVNEQHIQMSGAGGFDAYDLRSKSCEISISGVGSANIYVTESLDATVSGVGGITYKGNPQQVKTDVSGLGSIRQADKEENK